jgi:hypothetical protein
MTDRRNVCAGDVVHLTALMGSDSAAVVGDGLGSESVSLLQDLPADFRNCLFRICMPLKYEAHKNLNRMMSSTAFKGIASMSKKERRKSLSITSTQDLKQIEDRMAREVMLNDENLNKQQGGSYPITYGQHIQLQHVQSKKFLTMIARTAADFDKECMKVGLRPGDEGSLFAINAQYKVRSAGSEVLFNDNVQICNNKLGEYGYLHHSRQQSVSDVDEEIVREVNLSEVDGHCSFQLRNFTSFTPNESQFLSVGSPVAIFHPETESYLDAQANKYLDSHPVYLRQYGRSSKESVRARNVFLVEMGGAKQRTGGVIRWGARFKLKHLLTGKYLYSMDQDQALQLQRTGSIFSLASTEGHKESAPIEVSANVLLKHMPHEGGELYLSDAKQLLYSGPHTGQTPAAAAVAADDDDLHESEQRTTVQLSGEPQVENALRIQRVAEEQLHDLDFVRSQIPIVRSYIDLLHSTTSGGKNQTPAPLSRSDPVAVRYLSMLKRFRTKFIRVDGALDPQRQAYSREVKLIDACFWALTMPFRWGYKMNGLSTYQQELQAELMLVICDCLKANRENQIYVASRHFRHAYIFHDLQEEHNLQIEVLNAGSKGQNFSSTWFEEMIAQLGE